MLSLLWRTINKIAVYVPGAARKRQNFRTGLAGNVTFRALQIAFLLARHPTEPTDQLQLCFEREVVVIFAFITVCSDEQHAFRLQRVSVYLIAE
jgi:hypothetical protein